MLGEPSNVEVLGDCIKIGRRGSHQRHALSSTACRAMSPIRSARPTRCRISHADRGAQRRAARPRQRAIPGRRTSNSPRSMSATPPSNVIPGQARARFNIRFNDLHTQETLRQLVEERMTKACGNRIRARIVWEPSNANVFVTKPGPFTDLAVAAIEEVTGRKPELSTSGGTSDARFITQLLPGDRVRPGRPDHAPDRRAHAGRRSGEADEDLSRRAGPVFL